MNKSVGCICFFVAGMIFSLTVMKDLSVKDQVIGLSLLVFNAVAGIVNVFHDRFVK